MKQGKITAFALSIMFLLAIAVIGVFIDSRPVTSVSPIENVSTYLNVSNSEPVLFELVFDDLTTGAAKQNPSNQIVLTAAGVTEVLCNASVSDLNGQADIANGSASIYTYAYGYSGSDLKAQHYTNSSCNETYNIPGDADNRSVICRFNMEYFAFNETWTCNMTVMDRGGSRPDPVTNVIDWKLDNASVDELIAINLTTTRVEYGNLSVTDTSNEQIINVTNAGNVETNLSILGYGGSNKSLEAAGNWSMMCETGNITIGNHRWSNVTGTAWEDMINLTHNATIPWNITLENRTDDNNPLANLAYNVTYWRIRVPLGVVGLCNGTIEFAATTALNGAEK